MSRAILIVAAVLAMAVTARAGLSCKSLEAVPSVPGSARATLLGDAAASDPRSCQPDDASSADHLYQYTGSQNNSLFNPYTAALQSEAANEPVPASPCVVRELPAPPGSASLLLSGLLTIGAFQLVRCTKHVHLGALPGWYHTACPDRINHTVAFDFNLTAPPLCPFDQPVGLGPPVRYLRPDLSVCRLISQSVLTLTAPRGPPTRCL